MRSPPNTTSLSLHSPLLISTPSIASPSLLPRDGGLGSDWHETEGGSSGDACEGLAQCKLSFKVKCKMPPPTALVLMLECKDKSGRSRVRVLWEQAVTRPPADAMTLLKY